MEKTIRETRNISQRADMEKDTRKVEGYALLFNTPSDGLDFTEVIDPAALDGTLEASDVLALYNHDYERGFLARYNKTVKTLDLAVDDFGLRYSFVAPDTDLGDELVEHLKRGEITESSFCFDVDDEEWQDMGEGNYKRTIKHIAHLYDVSPVISAAYSATTVSLRGKEEFIKSRTKKAEAPDEEYYRQFEY